MSSQCIGISPYTISSLPCISCSTMPNLLNILGQLFSCIRNLFELKEIHPFVQMYRRLWLMTLIFQYSQNFCRIWSTYFKHWVRVSLEIRNTGSSQGMESGRQSYSYEQQGGNRLLYIFWIHICKWSWVSISIWQSVLHHA